MLESSSPVPSLKNTLMVPVRPARPLPPLQHDDTYLRSKVSLPLNRLSFSPGKGQCSVLRSVSVAVYSLGILEQGVMFLSLSAAVVEDNG